MTETVEITEAPLALQTESSELGRTLLTQQVVNLPLGGQRKFSFLARTAPGVLPPEPFGRDAAGGGFAANGVRSNGQNNFLLNGVDNNVNVIDFINQTAYVVGPSVEAIGEVKILTNGYNAEYGRGAGGVVNVTIKSGTNDIHGAIFEFHQNDALAANKWESETVPARRRDLLGKTSLASWWAARLSRTARFSLAIIRGPGSGRQEGRYLASVTRLRGRSPTLSSRFQLLAFVDGSGPWTGCVGARCD